MRFFNFASKNSTAQAKSPSQARSLYTEKSVAEVWDELAAETDQILNALGETRGALRALEFDDEISTALETRREAVISTPWRVESDGNDLVGEFAAEQIKPFLFELMRGCWQAVPYGYSVVEAVYRRDAGRIVIDRLAEKPRDRFRVTRAGELRYLSPEAPTEGEPLDMRKFILSRRQHTWENPYGEALLSRLYWPWHYRKHGWQFWIKWLERYGFPTRVGTTPSGTLPDGSDRGQNLADALSSLAQNSTLVINEDQTAQLSEPGSSGGQFESMEMALTKRIQKTILGQTLTTDVGKSGSYAAASVHNDVRNDRRVADTRLVVGSVQRLINTLVDLNFPGQPYPEFIMADERSLGTERADRDKTLIDAGAIKLTEEYLLDRYDFKPGDFVIPEPSEKDGDGKFSRDKNGSFQFATGGEELSEGQQGIEDLGAEALQNVGHSPISEEDLRLVIFQSSDPEDLERRLAELLPKIDPAFIQELERAQFAASVIGYVNAAEGVA